MRKLSLQTERLQQLSATIKKDCYAIRITVQGTTPVIIESAGIYNPGQQWSESGDVPGDRLVGKIKVASTTNAEFDIAVERQFEVK
jgi:hypothetical protein